MDAIQKRRNAVTSYIARRHAEDRKFSLNSWAKKAGINESTLRQWLNGEQRSTALETLDKLAEADNITVAEIIGDIPPLNNIEQDLIQILRKLPDQKIQAVLATLRALQDSE